MRAAPSMATAPRRAVRAPHARLPPAMRPRAPRRRVRRTESFNIYRTGDYVANMPSAKVRVAGHGCGRLIAKIATSADSCAAAAVAAGSLPFFAWSELSSFCFACAEASEQSAPATGYDIYASEDFPISFEEVKKWLPLIKPLKLWRETERERLGARRAPRRSFQRRALALPPCFARLARFASRSYACRARALGRAPARRAQASRRSRDDTARTGQRRARCSRRRLRLPRSQRASGAGRVGVPERAAPR